jgi:hypothetical protein
MEFITPINAKLVWRIRDEYIFRITQGIRGGYYQTKDEISEITDKQLIELINKVKLCGDS